MHPYTKVSCSRAPGGGEMAAMMFSRIATTFAVATAAALAALLLAVDARAEPQAAQPEQVGQVAQPDALQADFARSVYLASATRVADGLARPRAVVVLHVRLGEAGRFVAEVLRADRPEFTQAALATVARLPAPLGLSDEARQRLRDEGLVEAWLFGDDGRFLLKTLANPPRGA